MLEQVLREAETMEKEAIKAEADAQKAYEDFVRDSNFALEDERKELVTLEDRRAEREGERTINERSKSKANGELKLLQKESRDIHSSCDYVLKNFDVRQAARDEEVESLRAGLAFLDGQHTF